MRVRINFYKIIIGELEKYTGNKYYELQTIINKYIKEIKDNEENISKKVLYEYISFSLYPNENQLSNRGTYFGPFAILKNSDGTSTENPGKDNITKDIVTYWELRANETKNIFLKYRYLDLLYDFKEKIICENLDFTLKKNLINTGIELIKKNILNPLDGKFILKRLLNISISLSQQSKIEELISLIINYENQISKDDKPGLWGFSYDYLINNKKIKLSIENENIIISSLENKLGRFKDPFLIENCINRLGEYYKNNHKDDDLLKILLIYEKSYKENEYSNSDGLLISNYYQKLIDLFKYYSEQSENIKVEKDRLLNEFQLKSKNNLNSFKDIKISTFITDKEITEYIEQFFSEESKIIEKIVILSLPKLNHTKNQLDELVKDYPIQFLINKQLYDNNSFPVYTFGNIESDYNSHLYSLMSQNLHISSIFLNEVLNKFIEIYDINQLIQELFKSPLFLDEDEKFILKLLENYYSGNYYEFNFLAVPFIEKSIRYLCEINGFITILVKDNGIELKSLDKLIDNEVFKIVYGKLGEDFIAYLRVILTQKVGWNIRNNMAHGININYFSSKKVADRLLHIILSLSLIRLNNK